MLHLHVPARKQCLCSDEHGGVIQSSPCGKINLCLMIMFFLLHTVRGLTALPLHTHPRTYTSEEAAEGRTAHNNVSLSHFFFCLPLSYHTCTFSLFPLFSLSLSPIPRSLSPPSPSSSPESCSHKKRLLRCIQNISSQVTYEKIEGNEVMEGGREKRRRRITGRRSTGRWRKIWRREEGGRGKGGGGDEGDGGGGS